MSRDRLYAYLIGAFVALLIILSHLYGPDTWLFHNSTGTLVKTCAIIAALWWAAFGLWVLVSYLRETYEVRGYEPYVEPANVVPLPSRRDNPPTQPLPVAPDTAPAVSE